MSRIPNISERMKAVELLVNSYREAAGNTAAATENMQNIEHDVAMSLTEIASVSIAVTVADAQTLMRLSEKYGENYTFQVVLPLVKIHTSNAYFTLAFLAGLFRAGEADTLRLEVVQTLFKDILSDMIPDLQLQYAGVGREQSRNEFAKRRRFDYDSHGYPVAEDLNAKSMTAENLATLFHNCEKLGLLHELDQLTGKIASYAPNANVMNLEHLLLPLLKQLQPPVESGFQSLLTQSYNTLFRTILSSYINVYVQPAPLKPTGLERQPRGCSLQCEDCVKLDAFLKTPDRPRIQFSVHTRRRVHLEERLKQSNCSTETIKCGSPYTLVVKKTGLEWDKAMKEWKQRCAVASKAVEEIGFEKLRGLLGSRWEDAVGLESIKDGDGEEKGERRPLGDLAQGKGIISAADTGPGKKAIGHVGLEIIDLSGE